MSIIRNAIENGSAAPTAFIFKMILTIVTLSSGFKGGEIVPTFFIGSTFGVLVSDIIGLDPSFAAAVGLVAMFCGVVNCPLASVVLSVELFGSEGIIFFALAAAVSYIMSGYYGLYSSQKIMYSKLQSTYINKDAK
jgi:H+/Cl- antiporter ClcA